MTCLELTPHAYASCLQSARSPRLLVLPYSEHILARVRAAHSDLMGDLVTRNWSAFARAEQTKSIRAQRWLSIRFFEFVAPLTAELSASAVLPALLRAAAEEMRGEESAA